MVEGIKDSLLFQCRHDVEWSFSNHAEVFVEVSLTWYKLLGALFCGFIKVDNIPELIKGVASLVSVDDELSSTGISSTIDFNDLVLVLVPDLAVLVDPLLEPSWSACIPSVDSVTIALSFNCQRFIHLCGTSDGLRFGIKGECLGLVTCRQLVVHDITSSSIAAVSAFHN